MKTGQVTDYRDLWNREARRVGFAWRDLPEEYHYTAMISPNKKITVVNLFRENAGGAEPADFVGAGVAIRSPKDSFNEVAGVRLAMSRALHSINYHNGKNGRKK